MVSDGLNIRARIRFKHIDGLLSQQPALNEEIAKAKFGAHRLQFSVHRQRSLPLLRVERARLDGACQQFFG